MSNHDYRREWAAKGVTIAPDAVETAETAPKCREGCKSKACDSYAECLRASNVQIGNLK